MKRVSTCEVRELFAKVTIPSSNQAIEEISYTKPKMNRSAFISGLPCRVHKQVGRTSFTSNTLVHNQKVVAARSSRAQIRMISPEVARNAIAVYGVVIAGGGIGAFLRSGSKPSVIAGVSAGVVLAAAYAKDSVPIALGTAVALSVVFALRLVKTKKFVPAGILCIASVLAAVFFAASIYA